MFSAAAAAAAAAPSTGRIQSDAAAAIFVAGEQGGLLLFSGVRLAGPAAAARKDLEDGGLAGLVVRCDLPAQPVGSLA